MAKDLSSLPNFIGNRVEEFLNKIVGRNMDLSSLPIPNSRVEEYLEYIANNGGNLTKNSSSVRWNTLENVSEFEYVNIFDSDTIIENSYTVGATINGQVHCARYTTEWNRFELPCKPNDRFTIIKKQHDSGVYSCMGDTGSIVTTAQCNRIDKDGFVIHHVTIPNNPSIVKFNVNIHKATNNYREVMVFEDHVTPDTYNYIPFKTNSKINIEGNRVGITHDNSVSKLNSKNYDDAITELALNKEDAIPYDGKLIFNRHKNEFKSSYFRIPTLVRTQKGTLIAFSDIRYQTPEDHNFIDIGCTRSEDNGKTWTDYKVVLKNARRSEFDRVMDTTAIVLPNGHIMAIGVSYNTNASWTSGTATPKFDFDVKYSISTDDGLTWSETNSFLSKVNGVPNNTVGWLGGVGAGIIMKQNSNYPNRAILPIQICRRENGSNVVRSGCIYSDDNGQSWTMSRTFADINTSENMIIEVNGNLILSARRDGGVGARGAYISRDGGATWSIYNELHGKFTHGMAGGRSGCQGSWIKYTASNGHQIGLLSHPKNLNNNYRRDTITIYMYDFDAKKKEIKELYIPYPKPGIFTAGYSSLNYGFDAKKKETLSIIYEGQDGILFSDISFLIEKIEKEIKNSNWEGLDNVSIRDAYTFTNYATDNSIEDNKQIPAGSGGEIIDNAWKMCTIPVKRGKTYRIMNKRCVSKSTPGDILGSSRCSELSIDNNGSIILTKATLTNSTGSLHGRSYLEYTPNREGVTHISINLYKNSTDANTIGHTYDELMIWESSENPHLSYIPGGIHNFNKETIIDGDVVEVKFSSIDGLKSNKLKDILKEVSNLTKNTKEIKYNNVYNPVGNIILNSKFNVTTLEQDNNWNVCVIPIDNNKTYTIYEKNHSSNWIVFLDENKNVVTRVEILSSIKSGLFRSKRIVDNIPVNVKYIAVSCFKQNIPDLKNGIMVFEGNQVDEVFEHFIPYNKSGDILFDGNVIDLEFNSVGTKLSSSTVLNALIELSNIIQKAIIDVKLTPNDELKVTRVDGSMEIIKM